MRFLRRIEGKTKFDRIRNETYRTNLNVRPVKEVIEEGQLRWRGHLHRMQKERIAKRVYEARIPEKRKRGRPGKTWEDDVRMAIERRGSTGPEAKKIMRDRKAWKDFWKQKPTDKERRY